VSLKVFLCIFLKYVRIQYSNLDVTQIYESDYCIFTYYISILNVSVYIIFIANLSVYF